MSATPNKSLPPPKSGGSNYLQQLWLRCVTVFNTAFAKIKKLIPSIKTPAQLVLVAAGCLLALVVVYWVFDKIFVYIVAKSYVEEIAEVFDLNKYLASAIVYLTFVAIAFFSGMIISFSKRKRLIGALGIVGLLVAHSLIMWRGTSGEIISHKGEALKCYVITRDTVRYGERPGIDPGTGRQCRAVTPELVERLRAYEKGKRPTRIVENEPVFFDLGTGEPIVWYFQRKDGYIELFDLMGFDPDTGAELIPVSNSIVDAWKKQKELAARQAPQPINPEKYSFFDPITGKPRVWYRRNEKGDFEFYDRPGFHPLTGEPLLVVSRELIETWRKYLKDFASKQCYIITRDSVRYGINPGIDPTTGRQCRPLTAQMLERLREYEKGNRPKRITAAEPTFFDPRTGEPIVWYQKDNNGDIELFDLMGFHPESGEELLPVTKETVDLWKKQNIDRNRLNTRRIPQRVDPDNFAFFDPVTGKPRVWYWHSEKGEYEFYDNPGFHPRTGEQLTIITAEAIRAYKSDQEKIKKLQLDDKIRRTEELNAALRCDQLAANPRDPRKSSGVDGVPYDYLKSQAGEAIEACGIAVNQNPNEPRFKYQLARALEFRNSDKALEILLGLCKMNYPAAFDNAGGVLLRQNKYPEAERMFRRGVSLGDPDAMVSLASMIKNNRAEGDYLSLYERAASLGHEGAQQVLAVERQSRGEEEQQRQNEAEQQRRALEFFGNILRNVR